MEKGNSKSFREREREKNRKSAVAFASVFPSGQAPSVSSPGEIRTTRDTCASPGGSKGDE